VANRGGEGAGKGGRPTTSLRKKKNWLEGVQKKLEKNPPPESRSPEVFPHQGRGEQKNQKAETLQRVGKIWASIFMQEREKDLI